ncbi:MAG: hypothetical protein ABW184_01475 [Sphingobium sp.]
MMRGRPVRFVAGVILCWTAVRVATLLPGTTPPAFADAEALPVATVTATVAHLPIWSAPALPDMSRFSLVPAAQALPMTAQVAPLPRYLAPRGGWSVAVADSMLGAQLAFARSPRPRLALAAFAPGAGLSPREAGLPGPPSPSRWSAAAWLLWRDGGMDALRLGGAQAGGRIDYAFAPSSSLRPTLYARLSSAIHGLAAAEAAAGIAVRPRLALPVTVAVERREAVSRGGRSDFALIAAGGIDPQDIGEGFRLDGYGQTGVVGTQRRDAFVDGRLTVERPVNPTSRIALGAGMWGGAQPGTSRLDMGPQASMRLRVGRTHFRLGAEWREKVAGNAAPSSGPAISIGAGF